MLALRSPRATRAGSPRRWATGAVLAATLLAEVPRALDPTAARAPDAATAPGAACDRPTGGAPHRSPAAPRAPIAISPGEVGASPRPALHHLIGL
jgi:hypothetical protein